MKYMNANPFKLVLLLCGSVFFSTIKAQEMQFLVHYEEVETVRGELYQYSERYLGTSDVVKETGKTYRLTGIQYIATPNQSKNKECMQRISDTPSTRTIVSKTLPLSEETLMASSTAKKAESVAKQIYRLRETRINLLAGDVEHAPADGRAMEIVLKELDKQEKKLTAMFVGVTTIRPHTKMVNYSKDSVTILDSDDVLFRFSKYSGIVPSDDLSGELVLIKIHRQIQRVMVEDHPKSKKQETQYTEKLIKSDMEVVYNGQVMLSKYNLDETH